MFRARDNVWAQREHDPSSHRDRYALKSGNLFPLALQYHLEGSQQIAVYPLLPEGTTHFVVIGLHSRAGRSWKTDAVQLGAAAASIGVPLYLERTRSGQGIHGWVFFSEAVAVKDARRLAAAVLTTAGAGDAAVIKSFERLIPGDAEADPQVPGLFVAVPLQAICMQEDATVFVQPQRGLPAYRDQWALLAVVEKLSASQVSHILHAVAVPDPRPRGPKRSAPASLPAPPRQPPPAVTLMLSSANLALRRPLPPAMGAWLRDKLIFPNPEYERRKQQELSLRGVPRLLRGYAKRQNGWLLPRTLGPQLEEWAARQGLPLQKVEARCSFPPASYPPPTNLGTHQAQAVAAALEADFRMLQLPAEAGRSLVALATAARRGQPTLIVTSSKARAQQWVEEAVLWLGLEESEVGRIGEGSVEPARFLTVATYAALMGKPTAYLERRFGLLILDDCSRASLDLILGAARAIAAAYVLGLRDPSERSDDLDDFLEMFIGPLAATAEASTEALLDVVLRSTAFAWKEDGVSPLGTTDEVAGQASLFDLDVQVVRRPAAGAPDRSRQWNALVDALARDARRNRLVAADVISEARAGNSCLVFTARREHAAELSNLIGREVGVVTAIGSMSAQKRRDALRRFRDREVAVMVVTEQLVGAGFDCPHLSRIFLAYPMKSEGQLRQCVNLVMRHANQAGMPRVYDYLDEHVPRLAAMARTRRRFYRRQNTTLNPDTTQLRLPGF